MLFRSRLKLLLDFGSDHLSRRLDHFSVEGNHARIDRISLGTLANTGRERTNAARGDHGYGDVVLMQQRDQQFLIAAIGRDRTDFRHAGTFVTDTTAFRPVAAAYAACDVVHARLTPDGVSDAERHRLADETIGDHECQRRRLESSTQDAARCARGRATIGRTVESSRDDGARNWLSNTLSNRYSGGMDTIIRNVHDIDSEDRSALEHMLGRKLREQQQVIIHLASVDTAEPMHAESSVTTAKLPEWCHVFEGLSDRELAELDQVIQDRADLTRPTE